MTNSELLLTAIDGLTKSITSYLDDEDRFEEMMEASDLVNRALHECGDDGSPSLTLIRSIAMETMEIADTYK